MQVYLTHGRDCKMKLLTILCLLISLNIQAQKKTFTQYIEDNPDKVNHFSCGFLIGVTANALTEEITTSKTLGLISGVAFGILAGHLKETYDKNHGGFYSKPDLKATILGTVLGSVSIRIIFGNSVHRKKVDKQFYDLVNDNN